MINKILLLAFLIFSLLLPLHSQTGWSDPVRVSGIADYAESAITVDNNGVLSAFWCKEIKLAVGYYSVIYFSQSFNGDLTWTVPVNITPDYSEFPIVGLRAVTDSKNNIHIIFSKGPEWTKNFYKKFDGTTWSADYFFNFYFDTNMRLGVDNTDNLFATWTLDNTTYYSTGKSSNDSISWSEVKKIDESNKYSILSNLTFSSKAQLYSSGNNTITNSPFNYTYEDSTWVFSEMYQQDYLSCEFGISKDSTYYSVLLNGPSIYDNNNYIIKKNPENNVWEQIELISTNNDKRKFIFIDSKNIVHLFERNRSEDGVHSLIHTYGNYTSWQTETIHSDPNYYIFWFDVKRKVFEGYDEYYVLYCKSRAIDGTEYNMINFQTKQITTGIEEITENIPESAVLFQNYPNPFNNSTEISYSINQPSIVKVIIFNTKGEFIQSLINKRQNKGQHSILFNADYLNSGIYYYQLEVDEAVKDTKKMLYLK